MIRETVSKEEEEVRRGKVEKRRSEQRFVGKGRGGIRKEVVCGKRKWAKKSKEEGLVGKGKREIRMLQ